MGSRRGCISQVRLQIAYQFVQDYGIPLAEVARQRGVSASAMSPKSISFPIIPAVKFTQNQCPLSLDILRHENYNGHKNYQEEI